MACIAATMFAVASVSVQADPRATKAAVDEYVNPETTPERRAELAISVEAAPPSEIVPALKAAFRKDEQVAPGVELATRLQLRGAFSVAQKELDDHPLPIATLGLTTNDRGAFKTLIGKWAKAEPETALFEGLTKAFLAVPLDLAQVAEFKDIACSDKQTRRHIGAALEIIERHTQRKAENPEELQEKWPAWMQEIGDDAKRFEIRGLNGLLLDGWRLSGATTICTNIALKPQGQLRRTGPLAHGMRRAPYTISMWFKADDSFRGNFSVLANQDGRDVYFGFSADDDTLTQLYGDGVKKATIRPNEWMQLKWVFRVRGGAGMFVDLVVNGNELQKGVLCEGVPGGMHIECVQGRLVVGGIDYARD